MTYLGPWTCDKCGDTSDDEHAPCSCDDECNDHIDQLRALRDANRTLTVRLAKTERERDEALAGVQCGSAAITAAIRAGTHTGE